MFATSWRWFASDARHGQIVALSTLLGIQFATVDFGATPIGAALSVAAALATQALCARLVSAPLDMRSPLITGLSLALLMRAPSPLWLALAAAIGVSSKFVLRLEGRHVFNPSGFAIVALILGRAPVWVSPGQWGSEPGFALALALFALLILPLARRADVTLAFLAAWAALLAERAFSLGDPVAIPIHQFSSGSLLVFAFFMISDPPTTPNAPVGRVLFAIAVAAFAHWLAFHEQQRPALYFALIALSPLTLLINRILRAPSFHWRFGIPEGAKS